MGSHFAGLPHGHDWLQVRPAQLQPWRMQIISTVLPADPTFTPAAVAAKATLHAHLSKGRDRHQPSLHLHGGLLVAQQEVQSVRAPFQNVGGAPDTPKVRSLSSIRLQCACDRIPAAIG